MAKTLNRREFLYGSATILAGTAIAACAPKSAPPASQPTAQTGSEPVAEPTTAVEPAPSTGEATKVTIFVGFGTGTDEGQIAKHEAIAADFNATRDDIQAEFLTVPWAERNTKFTTMLAGGMTPEMCMPIGVGGCAAYFDEWLDIKPYVDRDNYDLSGFVGRTVEFHTYPDKMVGLPMGAYPEVMFYNEDLFDMGEVEYVTHDWTDNSWNFDTLVETAKQLTWDTAGNNAATSAFVWEDTEVWGIDLSWTGLRDYAARFGGTSLAVSDDYKTAMVNSEGWVAMAQWFYDQMWTTHIAPTSEQGSAFEGASDPFGSGKVAMWPCFSWMAWAYQGWTDLFNWNMGCMPTAVTGEKLTDCDADTFVMCKSAKNLDAAWEVAKWFASPEVLPRLCENWGSIPARSNLLAAWKTDMEEAHPGKDWQVMLDSMEYVFTPNSESWIPDSEKIGDAIGKAFDLIRTGESTDVKAVMDAANSEIQLILDEYWKTH